MKKKLKIDKHFLIPKHEKLNEKEKKKLLEQYRVSMKELPKIPKSDAGIASLNPKPGDIIKIIRASPTTNESFFYRVVVNV